MAEALTAEERTIIWGEACGASGMGAGGEEGETFQNCLLSEGGGGMEKLCRAWDEKEKEKARTPEVSLLFW